MILQKSIHSPVGDITVSCSDTAIIALDWGWARDQADSPLLQQAITQLQAYFDGQRNDFALPLAPDGSAFQQSVWQHMAQIPYGQTRTYGELAKLAGGSARSVGTACGLNPIPVIIPCHRVTAANGIGGYSGDGGVETKTSLLRLEGALLF